MKFPLLAKMERNIKTLKCRLSQYDTESILGMIGTELSVVHDYKSIFEKTKLSSPLKQYLYLAGLLMSTNHVESLQLNKKRIDRLKQLLEEITQAYALMYFYGAKDIKPEQSGKYHLAVEVAMPAFLSYFNTADLAFDDQQLERLVDWFSPFDSYFYEQYGFTVEHLAEIYLFIHTYLQNHLDTVVDGHKEAVEEHQKWIKLVESGVDPYKAVEQIDKDKIAETFNDISLMFHVPVKLLEERFGTTLIDSFMSQFGIVREQTEFKYYTEPNPFALKPLWKKSEEFIFCPLYRTLLSAMFSFCYSCMEASSHVEAFYKNRDKKTEQKVLSAFKQLFKAEASYYSTIYDEHKNENDLLITFRDKILLVEIKAAKVKEPFRDPEKAYIRIRNAFRSDGGIQKAFNQAYRLKQQLIENDLTKLYDEKGRLLIEIQKKNPIDVKILCITAEAWGPIAINLSPLLEKPNEEPFPWACDIFSLDSIIKAFIQRREDSGRFIAYLCEREEIHEKVISDDELDICGCFFSKGSLLNLSPEQDKLDRIVFSPEWATVFDKLHDQKNGIHLE